MLADWIGSDERYFPFREDTVDLARYLTGTAIPNAETAIRGKGAITSTPSQERRIEDLFPEVFSDMPRPLFSSCLLMPLGEGPHLFIIEDATGGKTEAAIILAHRLMASGAGQGSVALPTVAAANAIYGRSKMWQADLEDNNYSMVMLTHPAGSTAC